MHDIQTATIERGNFLMLQTGAQLYTVRSYTQTIEDFTCTIQKIADIGYKAVQLSAVSKQIKPEQIREICDRAGISIVLTHSDPERILHDTDALIKEHDILGCNYIGLGCMPDKYRTKEWLSHFISDFKEPAKKIAAAGKLFMYHNHNLEFETFAAENLPNAAPNRRILEYLLEGFAPDEMGITLDTYWVAAAGADVCDWISQMSNRIPCVNLKDMKVKNWQPVMAPVMEGNLNFSAIFHALEASNCKYMLVEQDDCYGESPFDCLKTSYENLANAGYR